MILTDLGNYLYLRVHDIPEAKWKEMGKHISNIVPVSPDETVIKGFVVNNEIKNSNLITFTQNGMVKMTKIDAYNVTRYNKAMGAIKLKAGDKVVSASIENERVLIATKNGCYVTFEPSEIPVSGVKTSGVKGISLKDGDEVVKGLTFDTSDEYLVVFTDNKTAKRVRTSELDLTGRAKRGSTLFKKTKTVTYSLLNIFIGDNKKTILMKSDTDIKEIKVTEIPIMDMASTGSSVVKTKIDNAFLLEELKDASDDINVELPAFKEPEQENMDEFLEQFKL